MIKLLILGATGSIGTTCLNAIRKDNPNIEIVGLSAYSNEEKLEAIAKEFNCSHYAIFSRKTKADIKTFINESCADIALNAIAGADGLFATLSCLESNMDVALANKESVVMGGDFLFSYARKYGKRIIPVDSEHSAIYNLLKNREASQLIITASGGPFYNRKDTSRVTVEEALNHPTWKMGKKITIDSATLANKGLEVIEASFLFGFNADDIKVVIHRQSIVHSMIQTKEGAIYAQLSPPDMTLPIMGAITEKRESIKNVVAPLSFDDLSLTFAKPDFEQFPMLALAYEALRKKGSYPIAFNAANEVAVDAFLNGRIQFNDISSITHKVLEEDFGHTCSSFDEIIEEDSKARELAKKALC